MKRIGIIGASGYTGFELVKILARNPDIEFAALNSENADGARMADLYPGFDTSLVYTNYTLPEIRRMGLDLIFLAREHGYARQTYDKFNCPVIDLSQDLRFKNGSVYGLPEIFREHIGNSRIVANPGCYATASILAAYPLVRTGCVNHIIFDCKSGYSGAGRSPSYLNDPEHYHDNVIAYRLSDHQHGAEIAVCLRRCTETEVDISFTPHVIPAFRGILCTSHVLLNQRFARDELIDLYRQCYEHEPFVRIFPDRIPELHDVQHTNFCCLGGFESDDTGRVVVIATLDNLGKGASGQAVQNMNLILGFAETTSLT